MRIRSILKGVLTFDLSITALSFSAACRLLGECPEGDNILRLTLDSPAKYLRVWASVYKQRGVKYTGQLKLAILDLQFTNAAREGHHTCYLGRRPR